MITNTAFVSINCKTGDIVRYESGGDRPRKTHEAMIQAGASLSPLTAEQFRVSPPDEFQIKRVIPFPMAEKA